MLYTALHSTLYKIYIIHTFQLWLNPKTNISDFIINSVIILLETDWLSDQGLPVCHQLTNIL